MNSQLETFLVKKPTCNADNTLQTSIKEDQDGRADISPKNNDNLIRLEKKAWVGEGKIAKAI